MRGISRRHLARLAAADIAGGSCSGEGDLWAEAEAALVAATTTNEAIEAVAPALKLCRGCPALAACQVWAVTDNYTGIAAGSVYSTGRPRLAGARLQGRPKLLADAG